MKRTSKPSRSRPSSATRVGRRVADVGGEQPGLLAEGAPPGRRTVRAAGPQGRPSAGRGVNTLTLPPALRTTSSSSLSKVRPPTWLENSETTSRRSRGVRLEGEQHIVDLDRAVDLVLPRRSARSASAQNDSFAWAQPRRGNRIEIGETHEKQGEEERRFGVGPRSTPPAPARPGDSGKARPVPVGSDAGSDAALIRPFIRTPRPSSVNTSKFK